MIHYKINEPISVKQFIELLNKTTLGSRRPLDDEARVAMMLHHTDLLVTAWDEEQLVGVARSVTDFAYCCYLSDLAVDEQYQKQGIGQQLIKYSKQALHPQAKIVLLAAPQAVEYYPHIGFTQHMSAWVKS